MVVTLLNCEIQFNFDFFQITALFDYFSFPQEYSKEKSYSQITSLLVGTN